VIVSERVQIRYATILPVPYVTKEIYIGRIGIGGSPEMANGFHADFPRLKNTIDEKAKRVQNH
jgi:hypothetical protein